MKALVVDPTMSIDQIIAAAELTNYNFWFKCRCCGKKHKVNSGGWHLCSQKFTASEELREKVVEALTDIGKPVYVNGIPHTILNLPVINVQPPSIYAHKLVLYTEEKAAEIYAEYFSLYYRISSIPKPQIIIPGKIPLHLIVGWEKLREFAYEQGFWKDNSPYQEYLQKLEEQIENVAAFIMRHKELFFPFMSLPCKIRPRNLCRVIAIRNDKTRFDYDKFLKAFKRKILQKVEDAFIEEFAAKNARTLLSEFYSLLNSSSNYIAYIEGDKYTIETQKRYIINRFETKPICIKFSIQFILPENVPVWNNIEIEDSRDPMTKYVLNVLRNLELKFAALLDEVNTIIL